MLVDAGLYQGPHELRRRNWDPLPIDPSSLDGIALTHAHLDHCGYLPVLVRNGFSGPAVCTPETAKLAAIVLRDAAHLAEEDAEHANAYGYSKHRPALPLFDSGDAEKRGTHRRSVSGGKHTTSLRRHSGQKSNTCPKCRKPDTRRQQDDPAAQLRRQLA